MCFRQVFNKFVKVTELKPTKSFYLAQVEIVPNNTRGSTLPIL